MNKFKAISVFVLAFTAIFIVNRNAVSSDSSLSIDSVRAEASNFYNWPNRNGNPKSGINLSQIIEENRISTGDIYAKEYPQTFSCEMFNASVTIYPTNIAAQISLFEIQYLTSISDIDDPSEFNYDYGDVCKYDFFGKQFPKYLIFATRNNYLINVASDLDSNIVKDLVNAVVSYIDTLPGLKSVKESGTRPFFNSIICPDSLIRDLVEATNTRSEIKVLINNTDEFLGGSAVCVRPKDKVSLFDMPGKKDTNSDTIRFTIPTFSKSIFTSDLDSLKFGIYVINCRCENVDTTFWISRRIP